MRRRSGRRTGVRRGALRRPRADHPGVTRTFRFRLEPVRAHAERRETEAQSALAAALADETAARERLSAAEERSRAALTGLGASLGGPVTGAQLRAQENWIGRTAGTCQELGLDLDRRATECDARRGLLTEAARDHEVLVRLRDRRAAEHRAEQARTEQGTLDEIALGLHRRRTA